MSGKEAHFQILPKLAEQFRGRVAWVTLCQDGPHFLVIILITIFDTTRLEGGQKSLHYAGNEATS